MRYLHILIVGGEAVGLEKLKILLSHCPEADISLVSKTIDLKIVQLAAQHPSVTLYQKDFSPADFYDREVAIIATDDTKENTLIRQYAKSMRVLVYIANMPALCDFYLGSGN